jgi:hypothetical protein
MNRPIRQSLKTAEFNQPHASDENPSVVEFRHHVKGSKRIQPFISPVKQPCFFPSVCPVPNNQQYRFLYSFHLPILSLCFDLSVSCRLHRCYQVTSALVLGNASELAVRW